MAIADKIFKMSGLEGLLELMKTLDYHEADSLFSDEWDDNRVSEYRDESYKWGDRDVFISVDFGTPEDSMFTIGYKNLNADINPTYWVGRNPLRAEDMEIGTHFTLSSEEGVVTDVGVKVDKAYWEISSLVDSKVSGEVNNLINEFPEQIKFYFGGEEVEL